MRCAVLHAVPLTGGAPAGAGGEQRGAGVRGGVVVGVTKGFLYAAGGGPVAATANSSGSPGPFVAALNLSINARMNPPELSMHLPLLGPASYLQARARAAPSERAGRGVASGVGLRREGLPGREWRASLTWIEAASRRLQPVACRALRRRLAMHCMRGGEVAWIARRAGSAAAQNQCQSQARRPWSK